MHTAKQARFDMHTVCSNWLKKLNNKIGKSLEATEV